MVRRTASEGQQVRPRGRPRKDASKFTNAENEVLDDSGRDISDKGRDIKPNGTRLVKPSEIEEFGLAKEDKNMEKEVEIPCLMDSIDIEEGENKIRITLIKQKNRMFRLQVFFNGTEIRPATFTGHAAATNYWTLLKDKDKSKKSIEI